MESVKLDFFILGAQKAGSSWLADQLRSHPEIFLPDQEIHFFENENNFARGERWYARHFRNAHSGQLIGEKTPSMFIENAQGRVRPVPQRLFRINPDMRLLVVLRDPIARAVSALRHHMWQRRVSPNANVADLLIGCQAREVQAWGVLEQGLYHRQLSYVWDVFPEEQVAIWIFEEDVVQRAQAMLQEVYDFLGLSVPVEVGRVGLSRNRSVVTRSCLTANYYLPWLGPVWQLTDRLEPGPRLDIPADLKADLRDFYRDDIKALEHALGRSLDIWDASAN